MCKVIVRKAVDMVGNIVTCSEQDNAELYDKVKGILVDSFFHQSAPGKVTDIP